MGEAKRRKQQLGDLYGTPEGSNKPSVLDMPRTAEQVKQIAMYADRLKLTVCIIDMVSLSPGEMAKLKAIVWPVEVHIGGNVYGQEEANG